MSDCIDNNKKTESNSYRGYLKICLQALNLACKHIEESGTECPNGVYENDTSLNNCNCDKLCKASKQEWLCWRKYFIAEAKKQ